MARLLVVEDEPTDRVILANLLERMGHDVYFAADAEEAFKTYLKNDIEIIITDLNMPHVDGLEFIGAVKALFPKAAMIAVSGKGPELLAEAERNGALAALSKPIDPEELRKAIAEAAADTLGRGKEDEGIMAPNDGPFILIVEDNPDQAALIQAAFKMNLAESRTHLVFYGWEAQAYLNRESPYHDWTRHPAPSLIVLDLGLPDITGFEILEWMAESKWLAKIPVIVLTASEDPEHERRAYALGIHRYIRKLDDYGELVVAVREELGLRDVVNTTMAVTSGEAPGPEDLTVEPRKAKRLTGVALFSLSLFEMTAIVVAYEAMRYASTSGVAPVPLYVMATSYIAISALVVVYFVTGVQRRRHAVETENERLIVALQRSLAEVDTLSGLLPICAHCKKVKDSEGYWHQIESYISSRSEAVFRHGLCEECVNAVLPEEADKAS